MRGSNVASFFCASARVASSIHASVLSRSPIAVRRLATSASIAALWPGGKYFAT